MLIALMGRVQKAEWRVEDLEKQLRTGVATMEKGRVISNSQFETMILEAIGNGDHQYGVSKNWVKLYLRDKHSISWSTYYNKKLNNAFKSMKEKGMVIACDLSQLYSIPK